MILDSCVDLIWIIYNPLLLLDIYIFSVIFDGLFIFDVKYDSFLGFFQDFFKHHLIQVSRVWHWRVYANKIDVGYFSQSFKKLTILNVE